MAAPPRAFAPAMMDQNELKKLVGYKARGLSLVPITDQLPAFTPHSRTYGPAHKTDKRPRASKPLTDALPQAVDDYVKSDMVVGLGTGSTAYFAVERVGEKLKSGELKNILAIPTSIRTKEQVGLHPIIRT